MTTLLIDRFADISEVENFRIMKTKILKNLKVSQNYEKSKIILLREKVIISVRDVEAVEYFLLPLPAPYSV